MAYGPSFEKATKCTRLACFSKILYLLFVHRPEGWSMTGVCKATIGRIPIAASSLVDAQINLAANGWLQKNKHEQMNKWKHTKTYAWFINSSNTSDACKSNLFFRPLTFHHPWKDPTRLRITIGFEVIEVQKHEMILTILNHSKPLKCQWCVGPHLILLYHWILYMIFWYCLIHTCELTCFLASLALIIPPVSHEGRTGRTGRTKANKLNFCFKLFHCFAIGKAIRMLPISLGPRCLDSEVEGQLVCHHLHIRWYKVIQGDTSWYKVDGGIW